MDWILQRMPPTCGIKVGQSSFTDDDYADDVALLGPKESDLQTFLYHFNRQANSLGLNDSKRLMDKTKIRHRREFDAEQYCGGWANHRSCRRVYLPRQQANF